MVQILIELKADVNALAEGGYTPLYSASHGDNMNCVKVVHFLLDHNANASARTRDGSTSLHRASENGRLEIARVLLEHGVDIEATNNQGQTPLQMASAGQHEEIVELLLEYGAK